ncbi:hypothetical protein ACUY1T_11760 [Billgrantia sp. Q4P2]|uniref:hypothetical protein n=1 Tax=Billgrantia sp. Q4P2 TaxID=3463857 RepID=UPI004056F9E7
MHSRSLSWLLCLLFGIALALPQAAMSAWSDAGDGCLMEAYSTSTFEQAALFDSNSQAQPAEKAACTAPCPACFGSSLALLSVAPPSLEPRWGIDEAPSHAPRDRPERPPRA